MIQSAANPSVKLYVVWRGYSSIPYFGQTPNVCFQTPLRECSLSFGRNLLLSKILTDNSISDAEVICFADDDGVWPTNLPNAINSVFSEPINWALGIYGPLKGVNRVRFPICADDNLKNKELLERGSSLGIYARVGLVRSVGNFDEELGLGSSIPIGEDLDFILRLEKISHESPYRPSLRQIHEYSSVESTERMISSLQFYCLMRTKGFRLTLPFIRRVFSLYIKNVITLKEVFGFLRLWKISHPNSYKKP